ncbi:protease [Betaproteobacteria bacterium]|nr:protease [Betaproteobacteria bacterium]GHU19417.1 protease [Betaproteobacteria bacterium]
MIRRLFQLIASLFRLLWRIIDSIRRTAVNVVLLVLLLALLSTILSPGPHIPDGAALIVRPSGTLVEQTSAPSRIAFLTEQERDEETTLHVLLDAIRAASTDPRIALLVIETDDLDSGGLSKLGELRAAIAEFKAAGKPVLARGERYSQSQYYLASIADEVHLAPDGYAVLPGFARYATYFAGALEALGIKIHLFRVGEYKSFAEPFTRTNMSDEDREATTSLLGGLWQHFRADLIAVRKLDPTQFDNYVNHYPDALEAHQGDTAKVAQNGGLIDRFSTRAEWQARIAERLGGTATARHYPKITAKDYFTTIKGERTTAPDHIAVLVAQGTISEGTQPRDAQPRNATGGDSFSRLIREARENKAVKAIVVRIDSPGGSAWASELIRRELELTRSAGKPVIVSMSSVAASGGYWIATAADEIWAEPTTITGSIGVFGLYPEVVEPMKRLGLSVDGVSTGPLASAFDPRLPLSDAARASVQRSVEHTYRNFLNIVAAARKLSVEEVDRIARGRVWTGVEAKETGLVDQLGGLHQAIAAAATRARLTDYTITWPTPSLPLLQQILQELAANARGSAVTNAPAQRLVKRLSAELDALAYWNDRGNLYLHCLCETP